MFRVPGSGGVGRFDRVQQQCNVLLLNLMDGNDSDWFCGNCKEKKPDKAEVSLATSSEE